MGTLLRLNTIINNDALPTLIDYDTTEIQQQLVSVPKLRGFYDATSVDNVIISDGVVTQLTDLSGNNRHFVQADSALAPTFDNDAFGHVGGLFFNGNQSMYADELFSSVDNKQGTVVVFGWMRRPGTGILLADANSGANNFYVRTNDAKALANKVIVEQDEIALKRFNYICAYDNESSTSNLYVNELSATGRTNVNPPTARANLGRSADDVDTNKFYGFIGHVAVFDEDVSKNAVLLNLLQEYAIRHYRMQ